MGAHQLLACQLVHCARDAFRQVPAIHKDQRGAMSTDQLDKFGMNGAPDRRPLGSLRRWSAGQVFKSVETSHILDRNLNPKIETFRRGSVNNRDRTIGGHERAGFEF